LFVGPSGVGKTRLARAVAAAAKTGFVQRFGDVTPERICADALAAKPCDIFFFDEVHRLSKPCQELLYPLIDDSVDPTCEWARIPNVLGERHPLVKDQHLERIGDTATGRLLVARVGIILATNLPGELNKALLQRVADPRRRVLGRCSVEVLRAIMKDSTVAMGIPANPHVFTLLAQIAQGLPRLAKDYLLDLAKCFPNTKLDTSHVHEYCKLAGIDLETGVTEPQRRYLGIIRDRGGAASRDLLAQTLGLDVTYCTENIELYLSDQHYLIITPSGRQLTPKGVQWLDAQS
jgi:Holliday junction DNA helicase RuvB